MQGDGPFPDGINVTIRRNYIYEDAYDKLSPENGQSEPHGRPAGGVHAKTVTVVGERFHAESQMALFQFPNFGFCCSMEGTSGSTRGLEFGAIESPIILMDGIKAESIILSHPFCV